MRFKQHLASRALRRVIVPVILSFVIFDAFAEPEKAAPLKIVIPAPISGTEPLYNYIEKVLELALELTEQDGGPGYIITRDIPANQARQFRELDRSAIDVTWSVLTQVREERYLPIPFPLTGGLFNYRVLLVNSDNSAIGPNTSIDQLKQFIAIQGYDWPDKLILEDNGFSVKGGEYQLAFSLLRTGYVDYFPRAALEVGSELALHGGLEVSEYFALYYPNYLVFFVQQSRQQLYDRILNGLAIAYARGDVELLFKQSELYKSACDHIQGKRVVRLSVEYLNIINELDNHPFKIECRIRPLQ